MRIQRKPISSNEVLPERDFKRKAKYLYVLDCNFNCVLIDCDSDLHREEISSNSVSNTHSRVPYLTGITGAIDTSSQNIRPVAGKSMRHALRSRFRDSTARFLSLTPSFRRKGRKMPANFCFGPDARPRPRNYFSPDFSLSSRAVYSTAESHAYKRDSSEFASLERTSEILSFLPAPSASRVLSAVA